jgi:hypothetical protein
LRLLRFGASSAWSGSAEDEKKEDNRKFVPILRVLLIAKYTWRQTYQRIERSEM